MTDTNPKLEHANLVVTDIKPTLEFLQAAFPQWRVRGEGGGDWYGKPRRWVHFGDDDFYLTLNNNGEGASRNLKAHAQGLAHIGFQVPSIDDVITRLNAAGHEISHDGDPTPHRRNVYFIDAAGLEFEFVEYLSDAPEERNQYV